MPMSNVPGLDKIDPANASQVHSPVIGQHTDEILREHGLSENDIGGLLGKGAIGQAESASDPRT